MANNKTADLTIKIGGIPVKGRVQTDLDTGNSKWSPYATGVGGIQVVTNLDTIYLESKKNPDGKYTPWQSKGSIDVFEYLADNNPQINSAYSGDKQKVLTAFYSTTTSTDTLNSGRLNQFNTNGAPQTAKTLGIPGAVNTAPPGSNPSSTATPTPQAPPPPLLPAQQITVNISDSDQQKNYDKSFGNFKYPESIASSQDRIKFSVKRYGVRNIGTLTAGANFTLGKRQETEILGTVILPIQPSISDSNGVEWGRSILNPIQAYAASLSMGLQQNSNIAAQAMNSLNQAAEAFKSGSPDFVEAMKSYFAGEAVGAQNLLSRAGGSILNPNLELLFDGPTLRPFNFTFRLSPRNKTEVEQVKGIIKFFKKGMSVKTAESQVFLKAPNIFEIEYQSGEGSLHKSLNKIKSCALLGCDVDYTPDGSYMTFNDSDKTMTSYQLTLRFSELDPIYEEDYHKTDNHPIGY